MTPVPEKEREFEREIEKRVEHDKAGRIERIKETHWTPKPVPASKSEPHMASEQVLIETIVERDAMGNVKVTERYGSEPTPDQATLEAYAGQIVGCLINLMVQPKAQACRGGVLPVAVPSPWLRVATRRRLYAAIKTRFESSKTCQGMCREYQFTALQVRRIFFDSPSALPAAQSAQPALPAADAARPTFITPARAFDYREHVL
jgi:hypothetical protein